MRVLLDDDFNRGNETPLAGVYAKPSGFSPLNLVSQEVQVATPSTDSAAYHNVAYDDDHWAETTLSVAVAGPNVGPCVRMSTANDGYYTTSYNGANFFLFEVVGGEYNQVDASVGTYADGDAVYSGAQGDTTSTTVISKIGGPSGTTIINYTDTTSPITGGRPGMLAYDGAARISRFRAGDFATGGPFSLDPTANLAIAGAPAVSGTVALVDTITATAGPAAVGTLAATGTLAIGVDFEVDTPLLVSAAGGVAATGALALGMSLSGAVAPAGTLSLAGTIAYTLALFELSPAAPVALAGAASTSGTLAESIALAGSVAVAGAASPSGAITYGEPITVSPTTAAAVAGSIAAAGTLALTHDTDFALAPTAAVAVAGAVAQTGAFDYITAVALSGTVAGSGAVSAAGALTLGISVAGTVAAAGSLALAGAFAFETTFSLAPTAPLAIAGAASAAGETLYAEGFTLAGAVALAGALAAAGDVAAGTGALYASQPRTASSWSYLQTGTLWVLNEREDWAGAMTFASPVWFKCDFIDEAQRVTDASGTEFTSRQSIFTSLPGVKQGDRVLIGASEELDPLVAGALEVRLVTRWADTFKAGGAPDFKLVT